MLALLAVVLMGCGGAVAGPDGQGRSLSGAASHAGADTSPDAPAEAGAPNVESCLSTACAVLFASATEGNPTSAYCFACLTGQKADADCMYLYGPVDGGYERLPPGARCD
jgi:hypothetical protein